MWMPEYNQPSDREQNGEQTSETTPAEVFDRETDTVPVSIAEAGDAVEPVAPETGRPRRGYGDGKYGAGGYGGGRPLTDVGTVEVTAPREAVPIGDDAEVVGSRFNEQRDAWEVVVTTPR